MFEKFPIPPIIVTFASLGYPPEQPDLEIAHLTPLAGGMGYDEETTRAFRVLLDNRASAKVTYEELKAKGIVFKSAPKEQFYGIEALITDGVGNWFSMTQPK